MESSIIVRYNNEGSYNKVTLWDPKKEEENVIVISLNSIRITKFDCNFYGLSSNGFIFTSICGPETICYI